MRRVLLLLPWLLLAFAGPAAAGPIAHPVRIQTITLEVRGQPATGRLYLPGDGPVTRLVVFCHGHTDTSATEAPYLSAVVAHTGAAVLAMDNRGAPGAWNPTTGWQDTLAATRWFKRHHRGIGQTVLWGWSMGGMTSGLALAHEQGRLFDVWVASFPVAEDAGAWVVYNGLGAVDGEPGAGQEVQADAGGCDPAQCPDAYLARSPTFLAARIHVSRAIFLHGVGDDNSPYEQSRELQAALIAHRTPTSFYTVLTSSSGGQPALAGHGFGPVADEAERAVERVLGGSEPMQGPDLEFVADETTGLHAGTPPLG